MPINNAGNLIGSAPYTSTLSALFGDGTTDSLNVDDNSVELLSSIVNLPENVVSVFIQNQSAENLQVFVGPSDTGFVAGTTVLENDGITIEPLGNNVYLKSTVTGTTIVAIIQYSRISFPPE